MGKFKRLFQFPRLEFEKKVRIFQKPLRQATWLVTGSFWDQLCLEKAWMALQWRLYLADTWTISRSFASKREQMKHPVKMGERIQKSKGTEVYMP